MPSSAPSAAAPVSSDSFGPSEGGPAYQSALAGGSGLELAPEPKLELAPEPKLELAPEPSPASSFDPSAPFAPTASFQPAAVGTAGEVVPAFENPYQAPRARVDRPLAEMQRDPLAGMVLARRLTRLLAAILNYLIFFVPIFLVILISGDLPAIAGPDTEPGEIGLIILRRMFIFFLPIIAINIYLLAKSGQSLGKKALGIKIVRTDGAPANLSRLLVLRYCFPAMIQWIPYIGGFFGLLDSLFIFGEERRCIHDHFADTMVVVA